VADVPSDADGLERAEHLSAKARPGDMQPNEAPEKARARPGEDSLSAVKERQRK